MNLWQKLYFNTNMYLCTFFIRPLIKGVGMGGGANLIYFLCKVLGMRSVQSEHFKKITFNTTPFIGKIPSYAPVDYQWD